MHPQNQHLKVDHHLLKSKLSLNCELFYNLSKYLEEIIYLQIISRLNLELAKTVYEMVGFLHAI